MSEEEMQKLILEQKSELETLRTYKTTTENRITELQEHNQKLFLKLNTQEEKEDTHEEIEKQIGIEQILEIMGGN